VRAPPLEVAWAGGLRLAPGPVGAVRVLRAVTCAGCRAWLGIVLAQHHVVSYITRWEIGRFGRTDFKENLSTMFLYCFICYQSKPCSPRHSCSAGRSQRTPQDRSSSGLHLCFLCTLRHQQELPDLKVTLLTLSVPTKAAFEHIKC